MRPFLRPLQEFLVVERVTVEGTCPECESSDLKQYPVVSEGGWWMVTKCQNCLHSVERERWSRMGSMSLLSEQL